MESVFCQTNIKHKEMKKFRSNRQGSSENRGKGGLMNWLLGWLVVNSVQSGLYWCFYLLLCAALPPPSSFFSSYRQPLPFPSGQPSRLQGTILSPGICLHHRYRTSLYTDQIGFKTAAPSQLFHRHTFSARGRSYTTKI